MDRCVFYSESECSCTRPDVIVADAVVNLPGIKVKTSVPVCIAHATQTYALERFVQRILPGKKPVKVRIVPREPYNSALKLLGIKLY